MFQVKVPFDIQLFSRKLPCPDWQADSQNCTQKTAPRGQKSLRCAPRNARWRRFSTRTPPFNWSSTTDPTLSPQIKERLPRHAPILCFLLAGEDAFYARFLLDVSFDSHSAPPASQWLYTKTEHTAAGERTGGQAKPSKSVEFLGFFACLPPKQSRKKHFRSNQRRSFSQQTKSQTDLHAAHRAQLIDCLLLRKMQ